MSEDSHYIYCLQNESKMFGLRVSISFDLEYQYSLSQKISYKKNRQNLQRYLTIPRLHPLFSIPNCVDIYIICIAYIKKNVLNYFSLLKNCSIYFLLSCNMQQSHHLIGCYATGINSLIIYFFNVLRCLDRGGCSLSKKFVKTAK